MTRARIPRTTAYVVTDGKYWRVMQHEADYEDDDRLFRVERYDDDNVRAIVEEIPNESNSTTR